MSLGGRVVGLAGPERAEAGGLGVRGGGTHDHFISLVVVQIPFAIPPLPHAVGIQFMPCACICPQGAFHDRWCLLCELGRCVCACAQGQVRGLSCGSMQVANNIVHLAVFVPASTIFILAGSMPGPGDIN